MPVDQQPCTTAFCEVHDAAENNGKEEVHVLIDGLTYDTNDHSTFSRKDIADLEHIIAENPSIIKLYLEDTRTPSESLLNNGIVDISLIDAPGLNRDSLQTTALFAQQEEIDVVVFVVSAENHFTLSAKEFLSTASKEKAYLFIVVNKYDDIKNKEKCKRLVLEQIQLLSPQTYNDAADLVRRLCHRTSTFHCKPRLRRPGICLTFLCPRKTLKIKIEPCIHLPQPLTCRYRLPRQR